MIYENIKKLCVERKISIRALEQMAELGNGTISGWKDCSPNLGNLEKVAAVLKVPVETLFKKPAETVAENV